MENPTGGFQLIYAKCEFVNCKIVKQNKTE